MAYDVFICYANQDKTIADIVCSRLEENGIRCWMAPRDILAGEDWDKAIMDAIPVCPIVILIFSSNSNDSPYCVSEIRTAFDLKKEILPVLTDNTLPHGRIVLYLGSKQWFYANTPPLEPHLKRLVDEVKKHQAQIKAKEEAAVREKARREAEARARQEAEEAKKAREIAGERGEAEESARERERQEAETAKIRKEAEEARKDIVDAIKARKEAEESRKERERQEAETVKARKETEEALKARGAAIKARKEAEEARKERERQEAETAKARKEADEARKAREADIKAKKEAEEARQTREAAIKAKKKAEEAKQLSKVTGHKTAWVWAGIGTVAVVAVVTILVFTDFLPWLGTKPTETPTPTPTPTTGISANITTPTPTTLVPATTPGKTKETPPPPTEYFDISFSTASFNKTEINGSEPFIVRISGNVTCLKDIPFDISGISITPEVIARKTTGGAEIKLQCSGNITMDAVPSITGEMADFEQELPLQFMQEVEVGYYSIVMKMKGARVNIGWWVDVAEYFDLTQELSLGIVKYNTAVEPYNYVEGNIRNAATNAPVADTKVELVKTTIISGYSSETIVSVGRSDSSGYYKTTRFITTGPFLLRATASGYETRWYNNTTDKTKATLLTFKEGGETLKIDFSLQPLGSISGKVVSDVDGNGIANLHVFAEDYLTRKWTAGVNTGSDGTYNLVGLPASTYRVRAMPSNNKLPYADEYYNNIYDIWSAQEVKVSLGQETTGINFSVAPSGTISGTVRNADGSAPLANVLVECFKIVNGKWEGWGITTDSQGKYTISGVPYGQFFVRARGNNNDYVLEYYQEVSRQASSKLLTVSKDVNPVNIDFTLAKGGSISGKVISDATQEAIAYIFVEVFDYDTGEWLGCIETGTDGTYTVHGLPSGKCRVHINASLKKLPYSDEYYNNTTNSSYATPVSVTADYNTPDIDFSLAPTS